MKIKTVLVTLLVASLVLGATACGPTEREQEYIDAARAVAEDIPAA